MNKDLDWVIRHIKCFGLLDCRENTSCPFEKMCAAVRLQQVVTEVESWRRRK